jgi:hypothetical protein
MKKRGLIVFGSFCWSAAVWAGATVKTETVEEQDKSEVKIFCSKVSEKEAAAACQKWLEAQSKTLGQRLLTSYCSEGEMQSNNSGCLYKATGELKYVLKKYKTETERNH